MTLLDKTVSLLKPQAASTPTAEVVLISCILLVCYETLQQNYGLAASLHLCGTSILQQWMRADGEDPAFANSNDLAHVIRKDIAPLFMRTKVEMTTFVELAILSLPSVGLAELPQDDLPGAFSSLEHARQCFDSIMSKIYSNPALLARNYPDRCFVADLIIIFRSELDKWYSMLTTFLEDITHSLGRAFYEGTIFLKLHYHIGRIIVATVPYADDMVFDDHI